MIKVKICANRSIEDASNYDEFYAPIFRLMLYDNITELKQYFSNKIYKED